MESFLFQNKTKDNYNLIEGYTVQNTQTPLFIMALPQKLILPANGGLRTLSYASSLEAEKDCLLLTQAMDQKHRLYKTGFSGTKLVSNTAHPAWSKKLLFSCIATYLNQLQGMAYTGCDAGTTQKDMEELRQLTPYILSGLGSNIDGSVATAYGVLGSITACLSTDKTPHVLVYGIGKVGQALCALLYQRGVQVDCFDVISQKATIAGCKNISHVSDPLKQRYDLIAFCCTTDPINENIAKNIQARYLVGSTNGLFKANNVSSTLLKRSILAIPSFVSSAGAVICDSIEQHQPSLFQHSLPEKIYSFVQETIHKKTQEVMLWLENRINHAKLAKATTDMKLIEDNQSSTICGQLLI